MTLRRTFLAIALLLAGLDPTLAETEIASPWTSDKPETRSRLIAGVVGSKALAAVDIELGEGWKTYWRFPGDVGGVPPFFDWEKSENVASVTVLYPAPKRMTDATGDTLGYKSAVVFPVEVTPKDPAKPVNLKLALDYGICREVCVPVQAVLALDLPPSFTAPAPASLAAAYDHVPRPVDRRRSDDPTLVKTDVVLDGPSPTIAIEAEFPGGAAAAQAYVFSPSGLYIPLPKASAVTDLGGNRKRFVIDLKDASDAADLKGKPAVVTLVSDHGLSETTITLN